jgi:hypothetical protein
MSTKNCTNCDPVYIEKCDKDICDIEVPANCVIVNEKYPCIGVNTKPTKLSVFLQKLVDYLCNLVLESSCTAAVSEDDTCCGYLEDKFVSSDLVTTEIITDESGCQKIRFNSTDEKVKVNSNDTNIIIGGSQYLFDKFVDGAVSPALDITNPTAPKIKFLFKTITFTSRYTGEQIISPASILSPIPISDTAVGIGDGRGTPILGRRVAGGQYQGWSILTGSNTYGGVNQPTLSSYVFTTLPPSPLNPEGLNGTANNCIFQLANGVYNIAISGSLEVAVDNPSGVLIWYLQVLNPNNTSTTCRLPLVREVVLNTFTNTEASLLFAGEIKGVTVPLTGCSTTANRLLMRIINATDEEINANPFDSINITFQKIG